MLSCCSFIEASFCLGLFSRTIVTPCLQRFFITVCAPSALINLLILSSGGIFCVWMARMWLPRLICETDRFFSDVLGGLGYEKFEIALA